MLKSTHWAVFVLITLGIIKSYGQVTTNSGIKFCGPENLNLTAMGPNDTDYKWYENATGGPSLNTGSAYNTGPLIYTQDYFVANPNMSVSLPNCASFSWYDSPTSMTPIGSGCSFTETADDIKTAYYVGDPADQYTGFVGPPVGSLTNGGNQAQSTDWWGVNFDAHQNIIINSVDIQTHYTSNYHWCLSGNGFGSPDPNATYIRFELLQNGNVVQSVTPPINCGSGVQTVPLGFMVSAGGNYQLRMVPEPGAFMLVSWSRGANYSANGPLDNDYIHMTGYSNNYWGWTDYYGGLYNWNISALDRTEVPNPRTKILVQDTCNVLCGDDIDLNTWIQGGVATAGNWTVSSDGSTVNQSINAPGPSFFVSTDEYINVEMTGAFQVDDFSDDDFVGFVFGYQNPLAVLDSQQFYLFDWKKASSGGGTEGFYFTQVNDDKDLTTISHNTNADDYWAHNSSPEFNILAQQTGSNEGWVPGVQYDFVFSYTSSRVVIAIDGGVFSNDTIVDVTGCFNSGRFGFYNFSQSNVTYSDFTYQMKADFDLSNASICLSEPAELVSVGTGGSCNGSPSSNIDSWSWDLDDGNTYSTENVNHFYSTPGIYDITLTIEDSIGCQANETKQIHVQGQVDVALNAPVRAICEGAATTITATPHTGATYEWFRNGISIGGPVTNDSILTVSNAGSYHVVVSNPPVCDGVSDTIEIITSNSPVSSISSVVAVCANSEQIYTAPFRSGSSYQWTVNGADSSIIDSNQVQLYFNTANVTIEVIETDSNGCSSLPVEETITVQPSPVPSLTGVLSVCEGDASTYNTTDNGNAYTWSVLGTTDFTINNNEISVGFQNADVSMKVVEENAIGCRDSAEITVAVNELPIGRISGDTIICEGESANISVDFQGSGPFTFTLNSTENGLITETGYSDSAYLISGSVSNQVTWGSLTDTHGCTADSLNGSGSILVHGVSDTSDYSASCLNTSFYQVTFNIDGGDQSTYRVNGLSGNFISTSTWVSDAIIQGTNVNFTITDTNDCNPITISETVFCVCPITPEAGLSVAICEGDSVQLQASGGVTYQWRADPTLSSTAVNDPFVNPLVDTYYQVEVENANGCVGIDSVLVTVNDRPSVVASNDTSVCFGSNVPLTASGALSYMWSPAIGLANTSGAQVTFEGVNTTMYHVTGTDVNGCADEDSIEVTVLALPSINVGIDTSICIGDELILQAGGGLLYSWSPGIDLSDSTISNPVFEASSTTQLIVTGFDANNCSNMDTVLITVNTLPNADAGIDQEICLGRNTQLQATGGVNYTWQAESSLSSNIVNDPMVNPITDTYYYVQIEDVNGCSIIDSVLIGVNELPELQVTSNSSICHGETLLLNAGGAQDYIWSPIIGIESETGASTMFSDTLSRMYYVTGTDANSCENRDSVMVTVLPTPVLTVTPDTMVCFGETVELEVSGAVNYSWSPANHLNSTTGSSVTFSGTTGQVYTVRGEDLNGCAQTAEINVGVHDLPQISLPNDTSICLGEVIRVIPEGAITYSWSPNTDLVVVTSNEFELNPSIDRSYIVTGTDANLCENSDTMNVIVLNNPIPSVSINSPSLGCEGEALEYSATSVYPGSLPEYQWYVSDDNGQSFNTYGNPQSVATISIDGLRPNDLVLVTMTSSENCVAPQNVLVRSDSVEAPVVVLPQAEVLNTGLACLGEVATLEATELNGLTDVTYQWYQDLDRNGEFDIISGETGAEVEVRQEGDYQVLISHEGICVDLSNPELVIFEELNIDAFANPQTVLEGAEVNLASNGIINGTCEWYHELNLVGTGCDLSFVPEASGVYTLVGSSTSGCQDTSSVSITVVEVLRIPDGFTPNGDGINDTWMIGGISNYEGALIRVYNRWGNVLYEMYNFDGSYDAAPWDGTANGSTLPEGVYFYVIDPSLTETQKEELGLDIKAHEGTVTLMR